MMNSSFLYHAWGLCSLECTKVEYDGKNNNSECPKQKAIICLPEVRKASFGQECVSCQRVWGANRKSECNHLNEDTTLQMQKRGM